MIRNHFVDGLWRFLRNHIKEKPEVTLLDLRRPFTKWSRIRKFYGDGGSYLAEDFKAKMERLWERYSNRQEHFACTQRRPERPHSSA